MRHDPKTQATLDFASAQETLATIVPGHATGLSRGTISKRRKRATKMKEDALDVLGGVEPTQEEIRAAIRKDFRSLV